MLEDELDNLDDSFELDEPNETLLEWASEEEEDEEDDEALESKLLLLLLELLGLEETELLNDDDEASWPKRSMRRCSTMRVDDEPGAKTNPFSCGVMDICSSIGICGTAYRP